MTYARLEILSSISQEVQDRLWDVCFALQRIHLQHSAADIDEGDEVSGACQHARAGRGPQVIADPPPCVLARRVRLTILRPEAREMLHVRAKLLIAQQPLGRLAEHLWCTIQIGKHAQALGAGNPKATHVQLYGSELVSGDVHRLPNLGLTLSTRDQVNWAEGGRLQLAKGCSKCWLRI